MNNLLRSLRLACFTGICGLAMAPPVHGQPPIPAPAAPPPVKFDFEALTEGALPADFMRTDDTADFALTRKADNMVLQMGPQPLVEGGILLGPAITGATTILAKVHAEGKRRSFPKFGVGLHGVAGFRLLVVPAMKEIQLVREEEVVARAAAPWTSGSWYHVELSVLASDKGGSLIEGRVWQDGHDRPEVAPLLHSVATPPGTGKASLWATPFSATPIAFDDVEIRPRP